MLGGSGREDWGRARIGWRNPSVTRSGEVVIIGLAKNQDGMAEVAIATRGTNGHGVGNELFLDCLDRGKGGFSHDGREFLVRKGLDGVDGDGHGGLINTCRKR